jgi:hypothetical protein
MERIFVFNSLPNPFCTLIPVLSMPYQNSNYSLLLSSLTDNLHLGQNLKGPEGGLWPSESLGSSTLYRSVFRRNIKQRFG